MPPPIHAIEREEPAPQDVDAPPFVLTGRNAHWSWLESLAGRPATFRRPVVFAGPGSWLYAVRGGADSRAAAQATLDAGLDFAEHSRAPALIIEDLGPERAAALRRAREPDAVLPAPPALSADAFDLPAPGRPRLRREFERQHRRAQEAGLRAHVVSGPLIEADLDRFALLQHACAAVHPHHPPHGPGRLQQAAAQTGAMLLCARQARSGELGGALLCLRRGRSLALSAEAVNPERLRAWHTYAFLLLEALRLARELDTPRVEGGRVNYAYKERIGFEVSPLTTLVYLTARAAPGARGALRRLGRELGPRLEGVPHGL